MPPPNTVGSGASKANVSGLACPGTSPSGVQLGELLFCVVRANSSNNANAIVNQAGFTLLHQFGGSAGMSALMGKIADATDVANAGVDGFYAFTQSFSVVNLVSMIRIEGALLAAEGGATVPYTADTALYEPPRITTLGPDRLVLSVAGVSGATPTFTWGGGATQFFAATGGTNRCMAIAEADQAAAGLSPQVSATASIIVTGHAHSIAIVPATVDTNPPAARNDLALLSLTTTGD